MMRRLSGLSGLLFILTSMQPAAAQNRLVDRPGFYLGLNVLIGGVSAFTQSFLSADDVPPGRAFVGGALGGAVTFGGQTLAGTGEPALRLPGVQLAAIGSSLARNAGRGAAPFSDVVLPLHPFYVRIRTGATDAVSVRVSAVSLASLARASAAAGRFQARLDWKQSLLSGGPVFRSRSSHIYPFGPEPPEDCRYGDGCVGRAAGLHRSGVTWYTTGGRTPRESAQVLAHEVLHLTQVNRDAILHAIPASDATLRAAGGPLAWLSRYVVMDAYLPLTGLNQLLSSALPPSRGAPLRLYELEVDALLRR